MMMKIPIKLSPKIHLNYNFFKALDENKNCCDVIISSASPLELAALVEVAYNTLCFRLPLSKRERQMLALHARTVRQLARARSPWEAQRALLTSRYNQNKHPQTGRGLPVVAASILASIILPLVADIINRK
jgi:hypothetical protein